MPENKSNATAPEATSNAPLSETKIGSATVRIFAGKDVASYPAVDGLAPEEYTHVQVQVEPKSHVPHSHRIYFNDDTARCLAAPIAAELIAVMETEQETKDALKAAKADK